MKPKTVIMLTVMTLFVSLIFLRYDEVGVGSESSEVNPKLIATKFGEYLGEWYDLSWSPAGDEIALVADGNLLVISAGGTDVREIASQPTSQTEWRSPSWSPNGSKIVAGGWIYMYVMNADGSNKTKITEEDARMPALSSDGSKIAFNKGWLGGLWAINIDGSNPDMILSSTDPIFGGRKAQFEYQDWSPDDSKIGSCVTEYSADGGSSNTSIWIMNSDGSNPTRVFLGRGGGLAYKSVQWSPDGTKIIYSLGVEDAFGTWIMNADGNNKTLLIEGGSHATWSPDGKKNAFYGGIGIYVLDLQKPYILPPDSDGDGMPDSWEYGQGLDPFNATDAQEDSFDEDGLTNLEEYIYKTSLRSADTDDDGLSDGLEVHVFGTDPTKKDSDGDGISDGLEAAAAGFDAIVVILPKNWIKVQVVWSNYTMDVLTNSSVLGVTFNSTDKQLTINVAGTDGTVGICNLTVPKSLVSSSSDIKIYLDNQPLDFSLSESSFYYYISVKYIHSLHVLMASFARARDTTAPKITNVTQSPDATEVNPDEAVTVTAINVTDDVNVDNVLLRYSIDDGAFANVTMSLVSGTTNYTAQIPGQVAGTEVTYKVFANDTSGNSVETGIYSYTAKEEEAPPSSIPWLWIGTGMVVGVIVIAAVYMVMRRR